MSPTITIHDHGRSLQLHYQSLLEYHGGAALAGAAIGFQAMLCAAGALSARRCWDRRDLHVVSWHNGPGIRDAIEFVTRTISRSGYQQRDDGHCGNPRAFRFEIGDGERVVRVQLRGQLIDPRFFELAGTSGRNAQQEAELTRLKVLIADEVIAQPADALFDVAVRDALHA